jgi:hypothetical protein
VRRPLRGRRLNGARRGDFQPFRLIASFDLGIFALRPGLWRRGSWRLRFQLRLALLGLRLDRNRLRLCGFGLQLGLAGIAGSAFIGSGFSALDSDLAGSDFAGSDFNSALIGFVGSDFCSALIGSGVLGSAFESALTG